MAAHKTHAEMFFMACTVMPTFNHAAGATNPRPFRTLYYYAGDNPREYQKSTGAMTQRGAVKAAIWRILTKEFNHAFVYSEDGTPVALMWRTGKTVTAMVLK